MYVFMLRLSMLKKGSRTGNFLEPQRAGSDESASTIVGCTCVLKNVCHARRVHGHRLEHHTGWHGVRAGDMMGHAPKGILRIVCLDMQVFRFRSVMNKAEAAQIALLHITHLARQLG